MKIDFEEHRIILENQTIYLTVSENIILKLLYENKNKVIKYEEITNKIYGMNIDEGFKNVIRKQISLLNKKIGKYIKIKNVRGVGYIIEEDLK